MSKFRDWLGTMFMPFKAWLSIFNGMNQKLWDRVHDPNVSPKEMWHLGKLSPVFKELPVKQGKSKKTTDNNGK
jgi:hypothetical protein